MGFLDSRERIQDVVLTLEGREQLSQGKLNVCYFSVHDDEIDYKFTGYTTSSLDDDMLCAILEDTPILEALVGKRATLKKDSGYVCVPSSFIFDSSDGSAIIPELSVSPVVTSSLINVDQSVVANQSSYTGVSVIRSAHGGLNITPTMTDSLKKSGFSVRVFSSGSDGLEEIVPSYDSYGRRSYSLSLHISVDDEVRPSSLSVNTERGRPR